MGLSTTNFVTDNCYMFHLNCPSCGKKAKHNMKEYKSKFSIVFGFLRYSRIYALECECGNEIRLKGKILTYCKSVFEYNKKFLLGKIDSDKYKSLIANIN